jgi:hypothetical protein
MTEATSCAGEPGCVIGRAADHVRVRREGKIRRFLLGAALAEAAIVESRSIFTIGFSVTALLLASACSAGAVTGGGSGNGTGGNGAGSTAGLGNATAASGTSCPSAEQVVASSTGYSSAIVVAGSYVYLEQDYGQSGNGAFDQGTFVRVPVGSGAPETLDDAGAAVFSANDSGTVAWTHPNNGSGPVGVYTRDALGNQQTLTLPMDAQNVNALAVDTAGNVFVLANASTGGSDVYRYSVVRQTFDMLHHNLGGLQGFFKDANGVAWIGAGMDGNPALFHEDVLGGAPVEGPSLPAGASVAGLDQKAVYQLQGNAIHAIDRASGEDSVAFDASAADPTDAYISSIAIDDTSFYWISHNPSDVNDSIKRVSKTQGGDPTTLVDGAQIGSFALGSCSVAYLSSSGSGNVNGSSSWSLVTRPK